MNKRKPQDAVVGNVKKLRAEVRMLQKVLRIAVVDIKKLTGLRAQVEHLEREVGMILGVVKPLL